MKGAGSYCMPLLGLLLCSCSVAPRKVNELPSPPQLLITRVEANNRAVNDLVASGLITVAGPDYRSVYGLHLEFLAPRRLKVSVVGALGIQLGTLLLVEDQYQISSGSRVYESGSVAYSPLLDDLGLTVSGDELWDLLLPFVSVGTASDYRYLGNDAEDGSRMFISERDGHVQKVWVHSGAPVITRELWFDAAGDTLSVKRVDKFKNLQKAVHVPTHWQVQVFRDRETYGMEVSLSSVEMNRGILPDQFELQFP